MEALVLVDLQQDFFSEGPLADLRPVLLERINTLAKRAHEAGVPVFNVRTLHSHDRATWALNMREDDQGLVIEGTPGAEPLHELDLGTAIEVVKTRDSAFFETSLAAELRERALSSFVLAGVSTEACIALTAADAYARDVRVTLAGDCIASADPAAHSQALHWLKTQYRQPVVASHDIEIVDGRRVDREHQ